jgi:hypothetical protein
VFRYVEGKVPYKIIFKQLFGLDNLSMKNLFKPKLKNIQNSKHRLEMENILIAKFGKNSKEYKLGLKEFDKLNDIRTITQLESYGSDIVSRITKNPKKNGWIIKSFGSIGNFTKLIFRVVKFVITNPIKTAVISYIIYKLINSDYANQLDFIKDIKELYNYVKPSEVKSTSVSDSNNNVTLQPGQLDE